jgi:hypothetical protein
MTVGPRAPLPRGFAKLIADFVDGCAFEPPYWVVNIDARGGVTVACPSGADIAIKLKEELQARARR